MDFQRSATTNTPHHSGLKNTTKQHHHRAMVWTNIENIYIVLRWINIRIRMRLLGCSKNVTVFAQWMMVMITSEYYFGGVLCTDITEIKGFRISAVCAAFKMSFKLYSWRKNEKIFLRKSFSKATQLIVDTHSKIKKKKTVNDSIYKYICHKTYEAWQYTIQDLFIYLFVCLLICFCNLAPNIINKPWGLTSSTSNFLC